MLLYALNDNMNKIHWFLLHGTKMCHLEISGNWKVWNSTSSLIFFLFSITTSNWLFLFGKCNKHQHQLVFELTVQFSSYRNSKDHESFSIPRFLLCWDRIIVLLIYLFPAGIILLSVWSSDNPNVTMSLIHLLYILT